ncbi:hypothetical protein ANN_01193 [Periplaneta americana]|uniref:Uncharacterized protein n=1 Tax=Periplaneta americana TaxID=6978 RepID=A0ABQ8TT07_PERAM|nr:hypothetical protein ANN_01193 [Periplaneta americana]
MSRVYGVVREWCRQFKEVQTNIHNEGEQGRKSVAIEDIVQLVDQVVREKRRFTTSELCRISRSSKIICLHDRNRTPTLQETVRSMGSKDDV